MISYVSWIYQCWNQSSIILWPEYKSNIMIIHVQPFFSVCHLFKIFVKNMTWYWFCFVYSLDCEDCNKEYEGDCPVHGAYNIILDTQVIL